MLKHIVICSTAYNKYEIQCEHSCFIFIYYELKRTVQFKSIDASIY